MSQVQLQDMLMTCYQNQGFKAACWMLDDLYRKSVVHSGLWREMHQFLFAYAH